VSGIHSHTVEPTAVDVLAAGAVLWRRGGDGVELALVHRPRYDDWSFPKGKTDSGESLPFTAVREVVEETGQVARLDAVLGDVRYEVVDGRKLVRYWSAEARSGTFAPNGETDELRWLAPHDAAALLSYQHDRRILERFSTLGPPASVVALVRHAKAGSREQWGDADAVRPLSGSGREQAQQLARLLRLFGPDRVATGTPLRCRETVMPLAQDLGLDLVEEPLFGEAEFWADEVAGLARMREIAAREGVTVLCSQGGVIPRVVGALTTGAHLPGVDPDDLHARKASTWLLTFDASGRIRSADYYERPTG
jgi:8-oxo-(d)GTP phosphatase